MKMQSSPGEQKRKRTLAEILGLNGGILCSLAILAAPANGCETQEIPCDVKLVIKNKCLSCHSGSGPGTVTLVTYADTQATSPFGGKVWERMRTRVNANTMPPLGAPALTTAERTTLTNWFNASAPAAPAGTTCP